MYKLLVAEAYWGIGISSSTSYHKENRKSVPTNNNSIDAVLKNNAICVKKRPNDVYVLFRNINNILNKDNRFIVKFLQNRLRSTTIKNIDTKLLAAIYNAYVNVNIGNSKDKTIKPYQTNLQYSKYTELQQDKINNIYLEANSSLHNILFLRKDTSRGNSIDIEKQNNNTNKLQDMSKKSEMTILNSNKEFLDIDTYVAINDENTNKLTADNLIITNTETCEAFHKIIPLIYIDDSFYSKMQFPALSEYLQQTRYLPISPYIKKLPNNDIYKHRFLFLNGSAVPIITNFKDDSDENKDQPVSDILMQYKDIENFNESLISWKNAISIFFGIDTVGTTKQIGKFSLPIEFLMLYTNINFYLYNMIISADHVFANEAFRIMDIHIGLRGKYLGFFISIDPIYMFNKLFYSLFEDSITLKLLYMILSVLQILFGFGLSISLSNYLMLQFSVDIFNMSFTIQIYTYLFVRKLSVNRHGIAQAEIAELSDDLEEAISFN